MDVANSYCHLEFVELESQTCMFDAAKAYAAQRSTKKEDKAKTEMPSIKQLSDGTCFMYLNNGSNNRVMAAIDNELVGCTPTLMGSMRCTKEFPIVSLQLFVLDSENLPVPSDTGANDNTDATSLSIYQSGIVRAEVFVIDTSDGWKKQGTTNHNIKINSFIAQRVMNDSLLGIKSTAFRKYKNNETIAVPQGGYENSIQYQIDIALKFHPMLFKACYKGYENLFSYLPRKGYHFQFRLVAYSVEAWKMGTPLLNKNDGGVVIACSPEFRVHNRVNISSFSKKGKKHKINTLQTPMELPPKKKR